ncbi:bifunctional DNA-formamidopyrimidine glycosylase/DNA-(apurinic or apyrimidinic site) lyase [Bythopirellula polymerisocia]|uniref:Formamidopyrimidine-DNA glycosylase n=1 Tax=Bythopirellula polymerisocia TaxID=2528003 RepID=A0A5C6CCT9_9BACT|nr:bifunctional DNA-formamidopyrimidine glycosylase/DNA-(apurinic or apyrimidinic site) lyase [Bythopirellula polymerisocia]TWU22623.1 Formamidopyrimidine-DNA glycosylase [Bythopirellula polymerisocia]
MPELPEVETMCRGILPAQGSQITAISRPRCLKQPIAFQPSFQIFRRRVEGTSIAEIDRAGKRVVIWLDSTDAVVIEPRMTGLVLVEDAPTRQHLRLRLELSGGPISDIYYWDRRGLGNVHLFSAKSFAERFGPENLGPDALRISAEEYRARLGRSRREIKVALLDQKAVAGIGNLYAAEILHVARIHPKRRSSELTKKHWQTLAEATQAVLSEAILYEGSTLSDGTYRNALNKQGGYQNQHRVYARAGQPCLRCRRSIIERIVQAQRATFFCAKCQR